MAATGPGLWPVWASWGKRDGPLRAIGPRHGREARGVGAGLERLRLRRPCGRGWDTARGAARFLIPRLAFSCSVAASMRVTEGRERTGSFAPAAHPPSTPRTQVHGRLSRIEPTRARGCKQSTLEDNWQPRELESRVRALAASVVCFCLFFFFVHYL